MCKPHQTSLIYREYRHKKAPHLHVQCFLLPCDDISVWLYNLGFNNNNSNIITINDSNINNTICFLLSCNYSLSLINIICNNNNNNNNNSNNNNSYNNNNNDNYNNDNYNNIKNNNNNNNNNNYNNNCNNNFNF